jgi:hypothetical protein
MSSRAAPAMRSRVAARLASVRSVGRYAIAKK